MIKVAVVEPGGTAILNRDDAQFPVLFEAAEAAGAGAIVTFGAHGQADISLAACDLGAHGSDVTARIFGDELSYRIGATGRHWVINTLNVLACVHAAGADIRTAAESFATLASPRGRGQTVAMPGGYLLIDDSYNANPVSMRAAFATLAVAMPDAGGRRIAVLGEMLELGASAANLHRGLACGLEQAGCDLVFCAGTLMQSLFDALPRSMRGGHAADAGALAPLVAAILGPGDVVLVKGSLGSSMQTIIDFLNANALDNSAGGPREA